MTKTPFAKQFRGGYFPQQRADESTRINDPEEIPPSKMRRLKSVAIGSQVEANPGMAGKQSFGPNKRIK